MKTIKKYAGMLALMAVGGVCGILTVIELEGMQAQELSIGLYLINLFLMLCGLYLAVFVQIIIHEAGHLVCGLLTGYRFSSFRIGSFMWIRQEGRIRLKRFSLAGTGGQCLLIPPDMEDGKLPYVLYNLGGSLGNLLAAAASAGLLMGYREKGPVHFFLVLMVVVGVGFALVNGVPMNMGGLSNDGYNARSLGSNPNALRAFWVQMKVNESQAAGVRVKDMPEEWFAMPPREDMGNTMCSALAVIHTSWLMDRHEFQLAAQSIDALMAQSKAGEIEVQGIYLHMLACDRIFCELLGDGDRETVARLLTKDLDAVMKQMKNMLPVIRTQYALALLYSHEQEEAKKLEVLFEKQAVRYPHPAEVSSEGEFMQMAKNRALEIGADNL